ncbi:MAG: H-X9-DG-CTERM domain-containing protein, partial [Kiritimatiellia bacterium]
GRGNVVFVDGHVESVSYLDTDYIADGRWERGRRIE